MFCIFHKSCPKSADNGNCSIYSVAGVKQVNMGRRVCGVIDPSIVTFEKKKVMKKANALKESKRKSKGN